MWIKYDSSVTIKGCYRRPSEEQFPRNDEEWRDKSRKGMRVEGMQYTMYVREPHNRNPNPYCNPLPTTIYMYENIEDLCILSFTDMNSIKWSFFYTNCRLFFYSAPVIEVYI
jgi:hypothetical protein